MARLPPLRRDRHEQQHPDVRELQRPEDPHPGHPDHAADLGQPNATDPADENGARSALRGHSLGRNIYGWWDGNNPTGYTTSTTPLNDKAFNGTGRLYADADSGLLAPFFASAVDNSLPNADLLPPQCKS